MGTLDEAGTGRGRWLALTAALLGWMFDGLEMGLFPLVARPALTELLDTTDETRIGLWFSVAIAVFLVGAATGGVLFGWLGDRLGRVRAMTLSVLTYALFSGLCGVATAAWQVAALRFVSALGMGGEWSLGVALVMEIWPNRSRALMAGLIGAAANVGYVLIAILGLFMSLVLGQLREGLFGLGLSPESVEWLAGHSGWRLLMLTGALPALLTFFIRMFVPESERWQNEHARGTTSHWATRDLLAVGVGAAAAIGIVCLWTIPLHPAVRVAGTVVALVVTTLGYIYPILRYLQRCEVSAPAGANDFVEEPGGTPRSAAFRASPTTFEPATLPLSSLPPVAGPSPAPLSVTRLGSERWRTIGRTLLGACLSGIPLLGTWASIQWAPVWADQLAGSSFPQAKAYTQICSGLGAVAGTLLAAFLGDWLGRRLAYNLLCLSSLASALMFFQLNNHFGPWFLSSVFLAGCCTASFYGWIPLYLPELFRTGVRATAQGFSYNFGRILAAIGALQTSALMGLFDGGYPEACSVMSLVYLAGLVVIWFAPETRGKPLPE
jgi:MFS family permease